MFINRPLIHKKYPIISAIVITGIVLVISITIFAINSYFISNPHSYSIVESIPTPLGYERLEGNGFAKYLRKLPLKKRGAKVQLYTGGDAGFQIMSYAVVELPMLSNAEQCADMCMRLRAEYLYNSNKYGQIHFKDVNGRILRFNGERNRKAFEKYLRRVYTVASTLSLSRELKTRNFSDVQSGDVFVYAGVDRGRELGHAMIVVDVAQSKSGDRVIMLAEGFTPARELHIIRNWWNPFLSPWFKLDADADEVRLSHYVYKKEELKKWE